MNSKNSEDNNLDYISRNITSDDKLLSAIGYLFIFFLIPLLGKRNNEYVQFHAKQGMLLFVSWFAVLFLGMIPVIGWLLIVPVGVIGLSLLSVIGLVNALSGRMTPVPILGKYANKIVME